MDSMNSYSQGSGFMDLLTSLPQNQNLETNPFDDDEPLFSTQCTDLPKERRERRKWSAVEDVVLISAWLNTSKDAVVGNEQKSKAFWSRIAAYYAASPKLAGLEKRESDHCRQRWQKINDQVCKFVGSYEAAEKQKSSGQNDDDVIKLAYEIFSNDYKQKFTLEHAWRELRHDQKWCGSSSSKDTGASKRRKTDDQSGQSSSTYVSVEEDQIRPEGVKASKAKAKKPATKTKPATTVEEEGKRLEEFQSMWEIKQKDWEMKQKDLEMKQRLSKYKLLELLLAKTEPLSEMEMTMMNKLMSELL